MKHTFSYSFEGSEAVITPALIYYKELIQKNMQHCDRYGSRRRIFMAAY